MIAEYLDVSYIVINPCIGFRTTYVSVKPAKLLVLPVIWLPSWISSTRRRPTKSEVSILDNLTRKRRCNRCNFDDMCRSLGDVTLLLLVSRLLCWIFDTR